MLQTMLADRFKLKFHRESRESQGYALLLGRNGSKLKDASGSEEPPHIDFGGVLRRRGKPLSGKLLLKGSLRFIIWQTSSCL